MKKQIGVILLLGIMFIAVLGLTSALVDQGTVIQGQNFTFTQTCNDATYITLSTMQFPNRAVQLINTNMTSLGSGAYQYNITNTNAIGRHDLTGISDGCEQTFATSFVVTPTGIEFSTSSSISYGFLLLILVLIDFLFFYIISSLDIANFRNDENEIVQINLKKYVKIVLIGLAYGLILLTLSLMETLALSLGVVTQFSGIIGGIFNILLRLAWPWTVIIIIWIGLTIYNDSNVMKTIKENFEEAQNSIK